MSAFIGLFGLLLVLVSFVGIIKPFFIRQASRKRVLGRFFLPGVIIFTVGVYLTPAQKQSEQRTKTTADDQPLIQEATIVNSPPKRKKFDIDKVFKRDKSVIDQYLGSPTSCETESESVFCRYDWMGTEIYFDQANNKPRTIIITKLSQVNFSTKALKKIGLKVKVKPTFSNDFVIKWDYVDGKEISILSDSSHNGKVSNIHIQSAPFTISHTESAGLPVSAVVSFALEHLYEKLNDKNYTGSVVFKLYMDGLIDKYGNELGAKIIHSYELSANDIEEIRRYTDTGMFHLKDNEFHIKLVSEMSNNPLAIRHWFNFK